MKPTLPMTIIREDFRIAVIALDRYCIASRPPVEGELFSPCDGRLQAHHVVYQKHLRDEGLDGLLWCPAAAAAVCERHHRRHHSGREKLRKDMIPARCVELIEEQDLSHYFDRYYA